MVSVEVTAGAVIVFTVVTVVSGLFGGVHVSAMYHFCVEWDIHCGLGGHAVH
jgi:hypothetical protein